MTQSILQNELIQRFRRGESDAFNALHAEHSAVLLAWLKPRCFGSVEYGEVSQDTWMQVWKKRESFVEGNFRAWLFTLAEHAKVDVARKHARRKDKEQLHEEFVATPDVEDHSNLDFEIKMMKDCIQSVGGPFVEVLRLRLDGMDDADIAQQLNIRQGTVYTRANRGRAEVKDCIERKKQ